jgi:hypothetical protein
MWIVGCGSDEHERKHSAIRLIDKPRMKDFMKVPNRWPSLSGL